MAGNDSNLEVSPDNSTADPGRSVPGSEGLMQTKKPRRRARRRGQSGSCFRRGDSWTIVYRTPEGKQNGWAASPTRIAPETA